MLWFYIKKFYMYLGNVVIFTTEDYETSIVDAGIMGFDDKE